MGQTATGFEPKALRDGSRRAARAPFVSSDTAGALLAEATVGQPQASTGMPRSEIARRDVAKREGMPGQARSPVPKPLEGLAWQSVGFPDGWTKGGTCSLAFAGRAGGPVSSGRTGRGRTHAATALGMRAVAEGRPVRFCQAARLVLALGKARREGALGRVLQDVRKARIVIPGELGHVPFDVGGVRPPYQVTAQCHEARSVIFTTDIGFSRWGTVFADDKLAAAIVDGVAHHGRPVELRGPSHRLEESLMPGRRAD